MRILLVEDEKHLSRALSEIFKRNSYLVDAVYDGEEALRLVKEGVYDVIVLDIMIPKIDGIQVLEQIRGSGNNVPVLLLTAKDEIEDKVRGLDAGADDYVTKPFVTEELLARIRSLSRRRGDVQGKDYVVGDLTLVVRRHELRYGGNSVKLSLKEYQIMEYFMRNPYQIVTKERIIEKIWGGDSDAEYNNVEVYISFIRKKLASIGSQTEIVTSRGSGYSLEDLRA
ncbi:MAG: response regulator transcription factor [Treponemataceae bacterium]|nr:response regulator transcription factor [Treponemataceae bacterium]